QTLFDCARPLLRWIRRLLRPLLKLFFNPNPLIAALHIQSKLNTMSGEREARREAARHGIDHLHYELLHNLVVETTRMGIELRNLQMRVESLAGRLEFNERRARALESAVVYRPAAETAEPDLPRNSSPAADVVMTGTTPSPNRPPEPPGRLQEGPGQRSRRRRRRRGRRGGPSAAAGMGGPAAPGEAGSPAPQASDQGSAPASTTAPADGPPQPLPPSQQA